jgi:molecular chaperone DnaJ
MTAAAKKNGRSAGAKSAGRAAAAKKAAPRKKRAPKKKKGAVGRALLLAFAAGLLAASAVFWFFRPDSSPTAQNRESGGSSITREVRMQNSPSSGTPLRDPAGEGGTATARAREEARKAYAKARQGRAETRPGEKSGQERPKEDVLKDILNDPFARRVFEDIYSHITEKESQKSAGDAASASRPQSVRMEKSPSSARTSRQATASDKSSPGSAMLGKVKGWLRKQIDDEQIVRLPRESLVPGARIRLEIQHGFSGESHVVEITLPPEFTPGKPMRLKGLGRRLGNLHGDLYVRIEPV